LKKAILVLSFIFFLFHFLYAENFTLYTGKANKTQYIGASLGGDIWDFLQLQVDGLKYLKDDSGLHSDDPIYNRGDFLGLSLNFVLKLPIHLIPYLDRFDYIQPYVLVGRGYGIENLAGDYHAAENAVDKKTGLFSKILSFNSFGYGLIFMITSRFGIKVDYRSVNISEHEGMGLPARKFGRVSFGICFGPYKEDIKRIKK
jgi:hypothetical protein